MENKKYVMCYRGSDMSNKIASATKNYIARMADDDIDIEFINIDKRKPEKLVNKLKDEIKPDVIYVWHDEELLQDLLKDAGLNMIIFNKERAISKNKDSRSRSKLCINGIGEEIFSEYKYAQGTIVRWIIGRDNTPVKVRISKYDYDRMFNKHKLYDNQLECKRNIIEKLKREVEAKEDYIRYLKNAIIEREEDIRMLNIDIEKKSNELDDYISMEAIDYDKI